MRTDTNFPLNLLLTGQDSVVNEQQGLLESWSIEFDVKECDYEYRWTELPSTNTTFKVPDEETQPSWKSRDIRKRYDHTAVSTGISPNVTCMLGWES